MAFFIGRVRIYVSFWFLFLAALFALSDHSFILLPLLMAIALHESAHLLLLLLFKVQIRSFSLLPYGARLDCDLSALPPLQRAAVYLAAPLAGVFVGIGGMLLAPASIFGIFNLCLGLFNLLPLPPLDGGNALSALCSPAKGGWAVPLLSALCLGGVWGVGVWLLLSLHNPSLAILALYLTLTAYPPKRRGR